MIDVETLRVSLHFVVKRNTILLKIIFSIFVTTMQYVTTYLSAILQAFKKETDKTITVGTYIVAQEKMKHLRIK